MINNNCNIQFYCRNGQTNRNGEARIEISINYCGNRFFITLPRKENPKVFKLAMASKRDNPIKEYCIFTKSKVKGYIFELLKDNKPVSKNFIKNYIHNGFKDYISLKQLTDEFIDIERKNLNSKQISPSSFNKYNNECKRLLHFFGEDKDIKTLSYTDFEDYKTHLAKQYSIGTIKLYISASKYIFNYAIKNEYISTNPLLNIETEKIANTDIKYLNDEELKQLQTTDCGKRNKYKDIFLFQVYTGLAYGDYNILTKDDIILGNKGYYIKGKRSKTNIEYTIPLTDDAIRILDKYNWDLPKTILQTYNVNLRKISDICGFPKSKQLHSHMARHTAATTYLLNNGIPKDIVQKILGHSSVTMTERYAKMLDSSVIDEMADFEEKKQKRIDKETALAQTFKNKDTIRKILKRFIESKSDNLTDDEIDAIIDKQYADEIYNGDLEKDILEEQYSKGEITEEYFKTRIAEINKGNI